jgi:hypothetical protein
MKATALAMLGVLLALMAAALWRGGETFWTGLTTSGRQLVGFLPVLVIAMLLAGFTEALLPKRAVETWLSDAAGWRGIALAWLAGVLTPGGSIVGLPLIAGLHRAGVGVAVLLRLPLETGFYGWRLTALRFCVSLVLPFIAGGLTLGALRFIKV